jgi:hypothetical protein
MGFKEVLMDWTFVRSCCPVQEKVKNALAYSGKKIYRIDPQLVDIHPPTGNSSMLCHH